MANNKGRLICVLFRYKQNSKPARTCLPLFIPLQTEQQVSKHFPSPVYGGRCPKGGRGQLLLLCGKLLEQKNFFLKTR
ncbi:TPA: hypothetical protein ACPP6H_001007, partial [Haemophilus influenzae]|uniref:Uncharacterized protein n=1 Tax=Haemophilus influenzae TaxID=727 RepID=A0A158T0B0_HAEIF